MTDGAEEQKQDAAPIGALFFGHETSLGQWPKKGLFVARKILERFDEAVIHVDSCPRCGKLYHPVRRHLCPECIQEENRLFEKARQYLKGHSTCNVYELANHLEVHESVVEEWIRERMLVVRNHPNLTVSCVRCGRLAQERFCAECRAALKKDFSEAAKDVREQSPTKNHGGFYSR
ncbi:MAG: hypothetical protein OWS03_01675 [Alicyclobacillaceae bacterium]|nr:hypothetical protein [Alicyclobacillaceae bacterium]